MQTHKSNYTQTNNSLRKESEEREGFILLGEREGRTAEERTPGKERKILMQKNEDEYLGGFFAKWSLGTDNRVR